MKLIIGQLPGLGAGVSRHADNCRVDKGDRVVINGVVMYLQEDDSSISIGDDSQLSWGIDLWCTDAHTITDLEGKPNVIIAGIPAQIVKRGINWDRKCINKYLVNPIN